jgi:hypothetical protein
MGTLKRDTGGRGPFGKQGVDSANQEFTCSLSRRQVGKLAGLPFPEKLDLKTRVLFSKEGRFHDFRGVSSLLHGIVDSALGCIDIFNAAGDQCGYCVRDPHIFSPDRVGKMSSSFFEYPFLFLPPERFCLSQSSYPPGDQEKNTK